MLIMFKKIIKFLLKFSKFKKITNNCPCYDNEGNFIGWFSRSVAVTLVTFLIDKNNKVYVLASKRGKGTPDPEFVGSWNVCCGYLDFNETCKDAAIRETYEETGIKIDKDKIHFLSINDSPIDDKRQNVRILYYTILKGNKSDFESKFSFKNNEKNEVDEIRFINLLDVDSFKWAFKHDEIIKTILPIIGYKE